MSGSSFSDPIPHTDKITQRLLRSGMPLTLKTARRQRTMLLAISGIVAILAHATFLLLLPAAWQKNQSSDYVEYYEPVAQKLAAGAGLVLGSKPALRYPPGIPMLYAATFWISDSLDISHGAGLRIFSITFRNCQRRAGWGSGDALPQLENCASGLHLVVYLSVPPLADKTTRCFCHIFHPSAIGRIPVSPLVHRRMSRSAVRLSAWLHISHYRSYKALRHCTAGRIHGPRLDVHCPLPATAPGSIFILRFGGLSPPDLALGGLGVAGKRALDSPLHERSQCPNRRPHVWYCKGS